LRGRDQHRAECARSLRRALTPAEFVLWRRIRARRLGGFKFVRQEPVDRYYVDFVCREQRLIVELDGGQHAESPKDRQRDRALWALGYRAVMLLRSGTKVRWRALAQSSGSVALNELDTVR